ncbi:hypothetical protein BDK51DRAFT_29388, partial [Blyttiomyces helicus]
MDGTFRICVQKVLLFIMLVIDENFKGVPTALFLLSAPLGAAIIVHEIRIKYLPTEADIVPMATKMKVELRVLKSSKHRTADGIRIVKGGINFMRSLFRHWLWIDILSMLSAESRVRASQAASIPSHLLPCRNNHTKGFNSLFKTYRLGLVKLNGLLVRVDTFVAYCICVIIPTIFGRRALECEILQLKRLCGPGPAPARAPEPAPEWGLIVWIADSVQDAAALCLLDLHLSNLAIMSWDPPSSLLVV